MPIGTTITLGSVTIGTGSTNSLEPLSPFKRAGRKKQLFNQSYNETVIPGRDKEWVIPIKGKLVGSAKDTDRAKLQDYHDNHSVRRYNDGIRDIDVIILPGSFIVTYSSPPGDFYDYTMTLVEFNQ